MLKIYMKQNINCQLKKVKCRIKAIKWFETFYWILEWYGWYLKNIEEYNPIKKRKSLVAFDGVIADILSNKQT